MVCAKTESDSLVDDKLRGQLLPTLQFIELKTTAKAMTRIIHLLTALGGSFSNQS